LADITQRIEDVRTFAGQTVTLSFWAKADTARSSIVYLTQNFGSGGSANVLTSTPSISYTTSWQRFSFTFSLASISGKTIGAGSYLGVNIRQAVANGSTLDIWGVQLEAGNVATAFQTATGTLAGELAACQRYYYRITGTNTFSNICPAYTDATNNAVTQLTLPVEMRVAPTSVDYSNIRVTNFSAGNAVTSASLSSVFNGKNNVAVNLGVAGTPFTAFVAYHISCNNNAAGYLGVSAEL
jgi:hypothetical protein